MTKNRKAKAKQPSSEEASKPLLELSEEEQWRIINQTGVLNKLPTQAKPQVEDVEETLPFADEIFNTTLYLIPMSFTLLLMEILVHWQYGRKPTYQALLDRMLPGVPILAIFIFYTNRYKQWRSMQFIFFLMSSVIGPRLIWLINRASWRVVMKQCPPLAVLWIYSVLQLDLAPSVLSLAIVAGWVWYTGMKIVQ